MGRKRKWGNERGRSEDSEVLLRHNGVEKIRVQEKWLAENPPPPNLTSMKLLITFFQLPENIYLENERLEPHLFSSTAAYELNTETLQSH